MLVIAGAGAGKTTTIAAKVKYLVEKKHIEPDQILVISFTNKAVGELLIISAIWYRRSGRMVPPVSRCRIFHSGDVVPHQISFFDILVHQRV